MNDYLLEWVSLNEGLNSQRSVSGVVVLVKMFFIFSGFARLLAPSGKALNSGTFGHPDLLLIFLYFSWTVKSLCVVGFRCSCRVFVWSLWNARNGLKFQDLSPLHDLGEWANKYIHTFQVADLSVCFSRSPPLRRSPVRWQPPPGDYFKVNVDAGFLQDLGEVGVEIIIHDSLGRVLLSIMCFLGLV